jgi:hypothetical protein
MSYNQNVNITPFEGSTLAQARAAVINAFQTGDQEYVLEMLKVFYMSTAKIDLITECERFTKEIEQQLDLHNSKRTLTPASSIDKISDRTNYLKRVNIQFYKKIMLLCEKNGLTEFGKVTARAQNVPTI